VRIRFNYDHCNDEHRNQNLVVLTLDRWTNRLSTHVTVVSSSIREFLLEQENLAPDRVTVVPNGVDLQAFQPRPDDRREARKRWNLPDDAVVVAGIGRLAYQKNFPLFLSVAERVCRERQDACFVIAGEGPDRSRLETQAAEMGLGDRVRFLGFIRDMRTLYPALDVFLLTSHFEGTPMTILEAMATRVPIVASRIDGIAEVIEDGSEGFLVDPGDAEAFANHVLQLLNSGSLHLQFAESAHQKVVARYSAQAMVKKVEDLYFRYLEPGPGKT
jgi:glycosyltransferase involved in cell wall biosynthesis